MKPSEFNIALIATVRAFRELRGINQAALASHLTMSECNYNKIENGLRALFYDQIKIISGQLDVSMHLIAFLADYYDTIDIKLFRWFELAFQMHNDVKGLNSSKALTEDEFNFIILRIRIHICSLKQNRLNSS